MIKFDKFVGSSYQQTNAYDVQRSINLFPTKSDVGTSKVMWALQGTPGLESFIDLDLGPTRNGIVVNDRTFVVSGNTLYEIFIDKTRVSRGTLNSQSGYVGIAQNGLQICIVDGPDGYIFELATNTLTEITDPYFLGANTVTFIDGYFMFNKPDSGIYYISDLYDGLNGDPLDFATAEGSPDNLVAVFAIHQQVFLLGQTTVQIVTNTGAADFPFSTVQAALIQYGCLAPYSVVQTGNELFWLGRDNDGQATFWKASGYSPVKISTQAVDAIVQNYGSLSDCIAYSYQENGLWWVVFNFSEGSWAYDVANNLWHERLYFSDGEYSRALPNFHIFAYGKHLVGDYSSGMIYEQSLDFLDFAGVPIRRERVCPYISNTLEYLYFNSFQLDIQAGVGISGPVTNSGAFDMGFDEGFDVGSLNMDPDVYPILVMSYSNNGSVWSQEVGAPMGKMGEYDTRALWRRLGRGRARVFRVWSTARVRHFWMAAYIDVKKGYN